MRTLAEKIVAASGAAHVMAVAVKNISSLSPAQASRIESALEVELKQRGTRVVAGGRAAAEVIVTLSEGVESLVWTGEITNGESRQVVMVSASKPVEEVAGHPGAVLLQESLVWTQPGKFLDFVLLPGDKSGTPPRVVILEAERLAFYESEGKRWDYDGKIAIPHGKERTRDVRGYIDLQGEKAFVTGGECGGDLNFPDGVTCAASDSTSGIQPQSQIRVRAREEVEAARIALDCGRGELALATGPGDRTQPDWIQVYVAASGQAAGTGAPTETDGPVMSLVWAGSPGRARAVVYNLRTGNYEGHLVTATCGH